MISKHVAERLNRSSFLTEALSLGLINVSALARYLQKDIEKMQGQKLNISAISMAINRLPLGSLSTLEKAISEFMKNLGDITVRSDLVEFSYLNSNSLIDKQRDLLQKLRDVQHYFHSSCKGVHETTLIVSSSLVADVETIFSDENEILRRQELAAVSIMLPDNNLETHGVYYTILRKLAWQDINITEVISTSHEITLIVSKTDVVDVFNLIMELKKN